MPAFNGKFFTLSRHMMAYAEQAFTQLKKLDLYLIREGFLECIESVLIHEALRRSNGRKGMAARLLGISAKTLYNKLNNKNKAAQIMAENRKGDADYQENISATK